VPSHPLSPLCGWRALNKRSYVRVDPVIPTVTSGMLLLVVYFKLLMFYFYLHNKECLGSACVGLLYEHLAENVARKEHSEHYHVGILTGQAVT